MRFRPPAVSLFSDLVFNEVLFQVFCGSRAWSKINTGRAEPDAPAATAAAASTPAQTRSGKQRKSGALGRTGDPMWTAAPLTRSRPRLFVRGFERRTSEGGLS
jgi:hypothetical protein